MAYFPVATVLLLLSTLTLTTTVAATSTPPPSTPPPTPTGGCSDVVIAISPCLPFISDPPNNLSNRPSSQCCDLFAASFRADEAICLCYLIRGNRLLGFPVNATKLLSLSSLCPFFKDSRSNSLQSICAVVRTHESIRPVIGLLRNQIDICRSQEAGAIVQNCSSVSVRELRIANFNYYRRKLIFGNNGAQQLPPLMSTTGPVISIPHNFDSDNLTHPLNTTIPSSQGQSSSLPVPATPGPTTSQKNDNNANQAPPGTWIFIIPLVFFPAHCCCLFIG